MTVSTPLMSLTVVELVGNSPGSPMSARRHSSFLKYCRFYRTHWSTAFVLDLQFYKKPQWAKRQEKISDTDLKRKRISSSHPYIWEYLLLFRYLFQSSPNLNPTYSTRNSSERKYSECEGCLEISSLAMCTTRSSCPTSQEHHT